MPRAARRHGVPPLPRLGEAGCGDGWIVAEVLSPIDMPECVVLCFFSEVIEALAARDDTRVVQVLVAAHGAHTIWELEHAGKRLAVLHPGVGAPLAVGFLEEAIALGGRVFVAVGDERHASRNQG